MFLDCVCILMFMEQRAPGGQSQSTCAAALHYYLALQKLGAQGSVVPQHADVHCSV